ncbi:MAG: hypothetical protein RR956_07885 [Christensenella sp.]
MLFPIIRIMDNDSAKRDMIRSVTESRDALIKDYKLDEDDGIRNTGGTMI